MNSKNPDAVQYGVEDTKAGKAEKGKLVITTLRIIWFSDYSSIINLCIGVQTIHRLDVSGKARSGAPSLACSLERAVRAFA